MPLHLLVVDTAAVSVKLRLDPVDNNGDPVPKLIDNVPNPNHTKDKVVVDRVDFTAYSHLGKLTQPVYHRLVVTLPNTVPNVYVQPGTVNLPQIGSSDEDDRRTIPLVPVSNPNSDQNLDSHDGKFIGDGTTKSFKNSRITFNKLNTYLGTITRSPDNITKEFLFELQYQYDPMNVTNNTPLGVNQAALVGEFPTKGVWIPYESKTDKKVTVTANNGLTYKMKIYYTDGTLNEEASKLWSEINMGPGFKITINEHDYIPTKRMDDTPIADLFDDLSIDFVLELADNRNTADIVDDLVTVTSQGKQKVSIGNHILFRKNGELVKSGSSYIKLFRGHTTRIYTNLTNWDRVAFVGYDLDDEDDDVVSRGLSKDEVGVDPTDTLTFDVDQTIIKVGLTPNGTVYLLVTLLPNSTGVNFDALFINHVSPTQP